MPEKQSALFRTYEAREREYAAGVTLDHIAAMHLRAAGKWHELAPDAERIEGGEAA